MMKKVFILILLLCLLLSPTLGYCGRINWGGTDRTIQLGRQLAYDLIYNGVGRSGVSTIVSTVSKLISTHLAFGMLRLSGASKTFSIGDGVTGQSVTLIKDEYDARTLKLDFTSDATVDISNHTGWTSVTWDSAGGGFVTLLWLNDTDGWIITGANGVTIAR
jgi:hypothetical protein